MMIRSRWVVGYLALLTQAMIGALSYAQLPSESTLPGTKQPIASLPGESVLPKQMEWGSTDAVEQQGNSSQQQEQDRHEALPDETVLPAHQEGDTVVAPALMDSARTPWLRLNLPGHTAAARAVAFSPNGRKLFSAGDDKSLLVWAADQTKPDRIDRWSYERTIRWQIQRGTRGRINALATTKEFVAMAGEGAMGGNGEILLIDPRSGNLLSSLVDTDGAHQQVIVSLSAAETAQGSVLASQSIDGCLVHWEKDPAGLWKPRRLRASDSVVHAGDGSLVARLQQGRAFSAVATLGGDKVVAGVYDGQQQGHTIWQLYAYDVANGRRQRLSPRANSAPHWDYVTAIVASGDGNTVASADGAGNVFLWDLSGPQVSVRTLPKYSTPIVSLALDEAGVTLAVGSASSTGKSTAFLELWRIGEGLKPSRLKRFATDAMVRSCALSRDGKTISWTNGYQIGLRSVQGQTDLHALAPGVRPPTTVAFSADQDNYQLGISKQSTGDNRTSLEYSFDTSLLRLDRLNKPTPDRWLPQPDSVQGWSIRQLTQSNGGYETWLYAGENQRSPLPLKWYEALHAQCWIPGSPELNQPLLVAVGLGTGNIAVFEVSANGAIRQVRRFRGHTAPVVSLAVSKDQRYLSSASLDGTVRVWPLAELRKDSPQLQRWGAEFVVRDEVLVASAVRPDGPLHFRGLRRGDRIEQIELVAGNQARVIDNAEQMLQTLVESDWDSIVTFRHVRGQEGAKQFQLVPAWQQLVTLFVADDGQWAYWSPAGYYDASFEGHKLFGWQLNRGVELLPDFFLAAQFRKQLEKPGVMSRLLQAGNLEQAFRLASREPPANSQELLSRAYRLKPRVQILSPLSEDEVTGEVTLKALVSIDASQRLVPPKAFANGVVATDRRLVSATTNEGLRQVEYEWQLSLPSDQRILLQVNAASEREVFASDQVVVNHRSPQRDEARLFLLSVGVDDYRDAQIPKLTTAVRSTRRFLDVLQQYAAPLYQLDAAALLNDRATKASWRMLTRDFATKLQKNVSPDDLLVIFLSGHGVRSTESAGYQFVTSNARYADVLSGKYADCLSFTDLSVFSEVPCRKLVILNTCHGGSAQPLMHREMKSVVRELQDDLLVTLAASGGEQEAVEGRFAGHLLEALQGQADVDGDGLVGFGETVNYVQARVLADSKNDATQQFPAAGPAELIPYLNLPLATSSKRQAETRSFSTQRQMAVRMDRPSSTDRHGTD